MFDIAACKCENFKECTCIKSSRVPVIEQNFLIDQRTVRKMCIAAVDQKESLKKKKYILRKNQKARQMKSLLEKAKRKPSDVEIDAISTSSISSVSSGEIYNPGNFGESSSCATKSFSCDNIAEVCDRTGVSDRTAAFIISSMLKTVKFSSGADYEVVDCNKVRRARKRTRSQRNKEGRKINCKGICSG